MKVYIVHEGEDEVVLVTTRQDKATTKYHALVVEHGSNVNDFPSDFELDEDYVVEVDGVKYYVKDSYDCLVARMEEHEVDDS